MFSLPVEIQSYIYQYDDTYKSIFEEVKKQILAYGCYSRRIQREFRYISTTYPFMQFLSSHLDHSRCFHIRVYEKLYSVHIPFDYPHQPPLVYDDCGKRLWNIIDWSPICTIGSLLLTYYCIPVYDCRRDSAI